MEYISQSYTPVTELIKTVGLMRTVEDVGSYYSRLIQELIVNLSTNFNDLSFADYQKVHVRGIFISISPIILNQFLRLTIFDDLVIQYPSNEQLALELSSGTVRLWPTEGQLPADP